MIKYKVRVILPSSPDSDLSGALVQSLYTLTLYTLELVRFHVSLILGLPIFVTVEFLRRPVTRMPRVFQSGPRRLRLSARAHGPW